ncbi:hypothetical protein [Nocardioides daejeonensis]|uniref:hypothetical protein n=1 Tax=Nocardioides daejeonensis TaxID=1046556 RepID=UPI000D741554|nr:hypothetical protein [Nocardioides daejeonensis]
MSEPQPEPRVVAQLRRYAGAVVPPYPSGEGVLAEVTRRRRRRAVLGSVAAAAVVIGASFGAVALLDDGSRPEAIADRSPATDSGTPVPSAALPVGGAWRPMAASPLSPRHASLAVWTGSEMVVVGGLTDFVCPPTADCATDGEPSAEAAAYNPATDTWRTLPDAPVPVGRISGSWSVREEGEGGDLIAWSGGEVVVVHDDDLFTLDPDGGTWKRRSVTEAPAGVMPAGSPDLLVAASYDKSTRAAERTDWVLDPATGVRTWLPPDPFGESYDRSIAWLDGRFWLLSMDGSRHFGASEPTPSRLAVLEDSGWQVIDEETPGVVYGQRLGSDDGRLIVPPTADADGWRFDPKTDAWEALPAPGASGCPLPAVGTGSRWVSGAGGLLVAGSDVRRVPSCEQTFAQAAVAVWAGDELLVWGGAAPGAKDKGWWEVTNSGLRWLPPSR